jgi:hypothetical protein
MTQGSPEEQEDAVRRLLAQSGPETLPSDVAARLDATLARLVAERDEAGTGTETHETLAPVEPLHRRRWPKLMLAAAAVVVAGYGIGTVVNNGSFSGAGSGSTADSATSGEASANSSQERSSGAGSASGNVPRPAQVRGGGPVRLHSGQLPTEVRRLLGPKNTVRLPKEDNLSDTKGFQAAACTPTQVPKGGSWLSATYDGRPAVLVLGPPRRAAGDHSVVFAAVQTCTGRLLDSATVRVP